MFSKLLSILLWSNPKEKHPWMARHLLLGALFFGTTTILSMVFAFEHQWWLAGAAGSLWLIAIILECRTTIMPTRWKLASLFVLQCVMGLASLLVALDPRGGMSLQDARPFDRVVMIMLLLISCAAPFVLPFSRRKLFQSLQAARNADRV